MPHSPAWHSQDGLPTAVAAASRTTSFANVLPVPVPAGTGAPCAFPSAGAWPYVSNLPSYPMHHQSTPRHAHRPAQVRPSFSPLQAGAAGWPQPGLQRQAVALAAAGLAGLAVLASPGAARAAQAAPERSMETVVVTASGFEQAIEDAPASVSVITREELQSKPFRDLTDAIRDIEGVSVTGVNNEKDIFIRGLPGAYTLILVDGRRQSTREARTNGNAGFEQSFIPPLEAIERIEVVRGPMSSLYGSDAMGGVINIITRKVPAAWGGSLSADYTLQKSDLGDSHQEQFYLGGPIKQGLAGLQVWGRSYHRGEDRMLNGTNDAADRDITARLAITPSRYHDILLEAGTTDVKRGSSPGKTLAAGGTPAYNKNSRDHYALSHTGRWGWATSEVSLSREQARRQNFTLPRQSQEWARNARAPEITNTVLDAKLTMPLGSHLLVAGGQVNRAELEDVNPGLRDNIVRSYGITQKALFLEDEWRITGRWAVTGGLRLDDHPVYGKHWSPRVYSVWHASDDWTFKGGVSRGFRAPDVRSITPGYAYTTGGGNCTYGPGGTCGVIIADPRLGAEKSTSYEVAALWNNRRDLQASATLFYTDFKDKVANAIVMNPDGSYARWSQDPNYRLWYNYNIDRAKIRGVELSGKWQATRTLGFNGNYTYTQSRQEGGAYDGHALARTPRHKLTLRADWQAAPRFKLWTAFNHHGKEINAGARIGSNGALVANGVREYAAYNYLDIGGSYQLTKSTTLNVALYNVGDKRLDAETYNTVGDGRRLWVGLNSRF